MNHASRKLTLNSETLKRLVPAEAQEVAGGREPLTPNPLTSWILPCITWNCGTAYGCAP